MPDQRKTPPRWGGEIPSKIRKPDERWGPGKSRRILHSVRQSVPGTGAKAQATMSSSRLPSATPVNPPKRTSSHKRGAVCGAVPKPGQRRLRPSMAGNRSRGSREAPDFGPGRCIPAQPLQRRSGRYLLGHLPRDRAMETMRVMIQLPRQAAAAARAMPTVGGNWAASPSACRLKPTIQGAERRRGPHLLLQNEPAKEQHDERA